MARGSFESFYLRKVALNEGCGCAEQIIGTRDLERQSAAEALKRTAAAADDSGGGWLKRWFRRPL